MAKQVKHPAPPVGFARKFFRAPIWLYNHGLGWMMGKHFLLLNHVGRKTGVPRQAVLEVVWHDPDTDTFYVNAGFGEKTQWYQNLLAQPEASIQVGSRKLEVTGEQISPREGGELFVGFTRRNPLASRYPKYLGFEVDGSEEDYRAMGEMLIFMALRPR